MPVRQDLYWVWAEETAYASHGEVKPTSYVQVLIELHAGKNPGDLHSWLQPYGAREHGFVPGVYRADSNRRFCTAWIARDEIKNLPAEVVKRFKLGTAIKVKRDKRWMAQFQDFMQPTSKVSEKVVLAIIDDDINFAHTTFADADGGSRFLIHWDQNTNDSRSCAPPRFGYTLNRSDKTLKSQMQRASHGTMVASLAGGMETPQHRLRHSKLKFTFPDPKDGASDVALAGVVLPLRTVADTSGGALAVNVYDALTFLMAMGNVAEETQVIVNLSFGTMAGSHDGTTLLDAALREMLTRHGEKLKFVVPTGNNFESQCHARFEVGGGKSEETIWRILPDDHTPSFLEIWLPKGSKVEISLQAPDESPALMSVAAEDKQFAKSNGRPYAAIIRSDVPANGENGQMVLLAISPTSAEEGSTIAPHGDWSCKVKNTSLEKMEVRMWIERDNASFGQPTRGRQSYFVNPNSARKPSRTYHQNARAKVTGYGSLNAMACDFTTLVVAGFDLKTQKISPECAAGSSDDEVRCPDGAAPSSESPMLPGLLGAAHSGSGVVRMGGTSAATPLASRFLVNELVAGKGIHRPTKGSQVKSMGYDERMGLGKMEF